MLTVFTYIPCCFVLRLIWDAILAIHILHLNFSLNITFFQKFFISINSETVWSKPVLTLLEIHYWCYQASLQHLETKMKKRTNLFLPIDIWLTTGFQRLKMYYANPCTSHTWININCKSVNSFSSSGNYWLFLK